jgi:hypothetical protein
MAKSRVRLVSTFTCPREEASDFIKFSFANGVTLEISHGRIRRIP